MTMTSTSGAPILLPQQVGDLLVQPTLGISIAAQVAPVVFTGAHSYRVPIVTADPTAAWVAEGAEITPTDATIAENVVTPAKLAGLTIISRELANDSSPAAAAAVGQGLARDLARKLDAAFFGTKGASTVQPAGLADLVGVSAVTGALTSTDPFAEAISAAEVAGATLTAFVMAPASALALAKIKKATGSNESLLAADPTAPTSRSILGVPVYVSPAVVGTGVVWGIPSGGRVQIVIRENATIETDGSVFFTSDRVAVKAIMRVGFAFPHPAAVVKIAAS